jgi:hypothetical protein
MAKVYDALKRLEEERSREAAALRPSVVVVPAAGPAARQPAQGWLRWPWGGRADGPQRVEPAPPVPPSADLARVSGAIDQLRAELPQVRQDLLHAVDSRLADVIAQERDTVRALSDIEQRVVQDLGDHFDHLGRELDRRVLGAIDHLATRVERLHARQSALIALVAAVLLLALVR